MNFVPKAYKKNGLLCRWVVLEMLGKVLVEKSLISNVKQDKDFAFWHLLPEDKARSLSLLETVLRNLSTLDTEIDQHLTRKTTIRIKNILRIACAEIFYNKILHYYLNYLFLKFYFLQPL